MKQHKCFKNLNCFQYLLNDNPFILKDEEIVDFNFVDIFSRVIIGASVILYEREICYRGACLV
jgi:hypothetical protein